MNAKQFTAALDKLELTETGFVRVIGVTDRHVRGWASGENDVPPLIAKLLRLMLAKRISISEVERLAHHR